MGKEPEKTAWRRKPNRYKTFGGRFNLRHGRKANSKNKITTTENKVTLPTYYISKNVLKMRTPSTGKGCCETSPLLHCWLLEDSLLALLEINLVICIQS